MKLITDRRKLGTALERIGIIAMIYFAIMFVMSVLPNIAQGASFQPVPNQLFGMHWGMSIDDAKKVRTLKLVDTVGKFTIYVDVLFTQKELRGITAVIYLFMNGRIGAAILDIHREEDLLAFVRIFDTMYGRATTMDNETSTIEWSQSGNIIRLPIESGIILMGNAKIIETLDEYMEQAPEEGDGPPVVMPGPKTGS
jgi:hypothetical protein